MCLLVQQCIPFLYQLITQKQQQYMKISSPNISLKQQSIILLYRSEHNWRTTRFPKIYSYILLNIYICYMANLLTLVHHKICICRFCRKLIRNTGKQISLFFTANLVQNPLFLNCPAKSQFCNCIHYGSFSQK